MPGGTLVSASNLRTLALDSLFQDHYARMNEDTEKDIGDLFVDVEAKTFQVQFAALYDVPVPVLWTAGDAMPMASLDDYTHTITVKKYAMGVPWSVDDEEDDQLGTLPGRVRELADEFAQLPIRGALDLITGTASLFDTVPTAYDGSALTVTATRFGTAGGNTITGSTCNLPGNIQTDFYSIKARAKAFKRHTATAEAFWNSGKLDQHSNWLLVFSADATVEQNARAAFGQSLTLDLTGVTGVSNILHDNQPMLKFWHRLSGQDWFAIYKGSESRKPFVRGYRHEAPILKQFNDETSDWAKEYDRRAEGWKQRIAMGIFAPECVIKCDN